MNEESFRVSIQLNYFSGTQENFTDRHIVPLTPVSQAIDGDLCKDLLFKGNSAMHHTTDHTFYVI